MKLQDLVYNWLLGGADPEVGCRLFLDYCHPSKPIARIITKNPSRHLQTIRTALIKKAELPYDTHKSPSFATRVSENGVCNAEKSTPPKYSTRNQWPFLADPECPPELKLLISDKITAYRDCIQDYENMIKATTPVDQHNAVRSLVTNFIANHEIYQELKHYKDHKTTLGKHPIFAQYKRLRELRSHNTMELIRIKRNIEHTIWRTERNIRTQNRPDLLPSRRAKLKELKMQLAEVDRLLH